MEKEMPEMKAIANTEVFLERARHSMLGQKILFVQKIPFIPEVVDLLDLRLCSFHLQSRVTVKFIWVHHP